MRRITQVIMAFAVLGTGFAWQPAPARAQSAAQTFQFCLQNPNNRTCRQIQRNGGQRVERRSNRERRYERRDDRRRMERRRDYDRRDDYYDRRDDRRRDRYYED